MVFLLVFCSVMRAKVSHARIALVGTFASHDEILSLWWSDLQFFFFVSKLIVCFLQSKQTINDFFINLLIVSDREAAKGPPQSSSQAATP